MVDESLFFVEYCRPEKLLGADPEDIQWDRYRPGFLSFERADNEALWLSLDDGQYVYRVVEEP